MLKDAGTPPRTVGVAVTGIGDYVARHGVRRVDLIKIDIEGNQMHALRGARNLLERDHPTVIAELNETCLARDCAKPGDVGSGHLVSYIDADNICATH
jgi:Methyltransferase FkbM domain